MLLLTKSNFSLLFCHIYLPGIGEEILHDSFNYGEKLTGQIMFFMNLQWVYDISTLRSLILFSLILNISHSQSKPAEHLDFHKLDDCFSVSSIMTLEMQNSTQNFH